MISAFKIFRIYLAGYRFDYVKKLEKNESKNIIYLRQSLNCSVSGLTLSDCMVRIRGRSDSRLLKILIQPNLIQRIYKEMVPSLNQNVGSK